MREIVEFFRTLTLFRGLETVEIEDIVRMVQPFVRRPGETLFRQGADSDGIYFIQNGLVEIRTRAPGDDVLTLARLEQGSVVGEVGLLDSGRRTATALAISPTEGYLLGRRHFEILRWGYKPASLLIVQRLIMNTCDCVRRSYERINELLEEVSPHSLQRSETFSPLSRANAEGIPFGSLPFFSQLSNGELKEVVELGQLLEAKRGTTLYHQGERSRDIFVVVRGALRTILHHGKIRFQIAVHAPGSFDGVLGMLDGYPNATSCEACEPAYVLALNKSAIFKLQAARLPVSWCLSEHIHGELAKTLRQCRDHATRLALERHLQVRLRGASDV